MTPLTAAATAAVLIGVPTVAVVSVWPLAGRINTRRDTRKHADVDAFTQKVTDGLIAQIRDGHATACALGSNDPTKLALAAYRHITAVHMALRHTGHPDAAYAETALDRLDAILTGNQLLGDYTACTTPLANAVAARFLLARLANISLAPNRGLAKDADANLAAAADALPNGRVFNPHRLSEHDPAPMHWAHAEWLRIAHAAGISDTDHAPMFDGDNPRPVLLPAYPAGHHLAHTNAMDTAAALDGNDITKTPGGIR